MNKLKLQTTLKICYKRFIDWQNIKSKIGGWRLTDIHIGSLMNKLGNHEELKFQ